MGLFCIFYRWGPPIQPRRRLLVDHPRRVSCPSYKEETEAPHQEVGLEDENAVSRPTGADLLGASYEGHPVFAAIDLANTARLCRLGGG